MEGNLALFHDCGCGKTLTALKIIEHHKGQGHGPALVVCPLSIIEPAWLADCRRFTPELSIVSLWGGSPAERRKRLAAGYDVYAANYETLKGLFPEIRARGFGVLIVDESSKMKKHGSQITRALLALAGVRMRGRDGAAYPAGEVIPHRYVLSGTPAPNSRMEYWPQMTFVAPGGAFAGNFYAFRNRYFVPRPLGRTGVVLWDFTQDGGRQEEFAAGVARYAHVVRKEDAVDLPEQVHERRSVVLSPAERAAYDRFRRDLVLRFGAEEVLASSALVEAMKARQLTSGFCYGAEGVHRTGTSKLDELTELLAEIGERQVIIWCSFRHEMSEAAKRLTGAAVLDDEAERGKAIADFQEGRKQYLIANPQSAGHGLTFVNCSYAVYFSLTWSYELAKQSADRIHRIGQRKRCTYYYLIAKDTIDEVIYEALQQKADLSRKVLEHLRSSQVDE